MLVNWLLCNGNRAIDPERLCEKEVSRGNASEEEIEYVLLVD